MTLFTILAASSSPVDRAQLMAQLRLDETADAEQLERLDEMIAEAVEHVQAATGLTLAPTDYEQRLDAWPAGRCVRLGAGPVRGIDAVVYVGEDGAEHELTPETDYRLALVRVTEGDLVFAPEFAWPTLADWPGAVRIRFAAGFNDPFATGSEADDRLALDKRARQAVIMLAATWFEDRLAGEPDSVQRTIRRLRVYR